MIRNQDTEAIVHCWGGPVAMMANYHAALAAGDLMAEWPMPVYPLRNAMLEEPLQIENGQLHMPQCSGLGVRLTTAVEEQYQFREDAIYSCLTDTSIIPPDEVWE